MPGIVLRGNIVEFGLHVALVLTPWTQVACGAGAKSADTTKTDVQNDVSIVDTAIRGQSGACNCENCVDPDTEDRISGDEYLAWLRKNDLVHRWIAVGTQPNKCQVEQSVGSGGSVHLAFTCLSDVKCGDGITMALLNEACDDGNTTSGDGCSATCTVEDTACADGTREGTIDKVRYPKIAQCNGPWVGSIGSTSGNNAPNKLCGLNFHVCNSTAADQTLLKSVTQADASRHRRATQHRARLLGHQRRQRLWQVPAVHQHPGHQRHGGLGQGLPGQDHQLRHQLHQRQLPD